MWTETPAARRRVGSMCKSTTSACLAVSPGYSRLPPADVAIHGRRAYRLLGTVVQCLNRRIELEQEPLHCVTQEMVRQPGRGATVRSTTPGEAQPRASAQQPRPPNHSLSSPPRALLPLRPRLRSSSTGEHQKTKTKNPCYPLPNQSSHSPWCKKRAFHSGKRASP